MYDKITTVYQKLSSTEKSIYKRTLNSIYNMLSACNEHRDEEVEEIWDKIMKELFRRLE
ncbi:MAG: hypothetical protein WBZ33_01410 [Thermoactinomyces sp.]